MPHSDADLLADVAAMFDARDPMPDGLVERAKAALAGAVETPALRVFTIEIPPRTELLNLNDRNHWAKQRRIARNLRLVTFQLAKIRRIPPLERAVITGYLLPPDNRRRDPANWQVTLKHCIDGLVDAGVLSDDSAAYVTDGGVLLGERARVLSFSLQIREAP